MARPVPGESDEGRRSPGPALFGRTAQQSGQHVPDMVLASKKYCQDLDHMSLLIRDKPKNNVFPSYVERPRQDIRPQSPLVWNLGKFEPGRMDRLNTLYGSIERDARIATKIQLRLVEVVENQLKILLSVRRKRSLPRLSSAASRRSFCPNDPAFRQPKRMDHPGVPQAEL